MDAQTLMSQAGWFASRRVDASAAVSELASAGYVVVEPITGFLREYSGLTIMTPDGSRQLWIDGERSAAEADPEWCRAYADGAGLPLVPVGGYSHMSILIDGSGRLWGGFDAEYGHLADSMMELVHVLLIEPGSRRLDRRLTDQ